MNTTARKVRNAEKGVILHQPNIFSRNRVITKMSIKCVTHSISETFTLLGSKQSRIAVGSAVINPLNSICQSMTLSICCPEKVRYIAAAIRTAVVMSTK